MDKPAGTSTTLARALIAMAIGATVVVLLLPPAAPPPAPTPPAKPAAPDFHLPDKIVYNRDIRPLLSDACFKCHGPASATRKADLRLDTVDGFTKVVAAGKPAASELFRRVSATDDDRMPPASSGKTLAPREVALLKRWIEQGGQVQPHWAFLPPEEFLNPPVKRESWARNEIDLFILARLESEKMAPSPEARPETLLRRVSLDLTGLPPTPEELDAFLADGDYEKVVDRLLASPRYGEHRARYWLDQARYGDTHGLHLDNYREMWPYRDWVIRAFNENMPFDRFVVEQVAGDLLPEPTLDQRVATGFNRCHVTTGEGGSIEEEVYVRNVVERVDATGLILMGLSLGCARCHDHKYDPLTQKDYYQLFAFFNSLDGPALDGNAKDHAPSMKVPTPEQATQLADLGGRLRQAEERLNAPMAELDSAQASWEEARRAELAGGWIALDPASVTSAGGATLAKQPDGSVLASGANPDRDDFLVTARTELTGIRAIRLDVLTDPSLPKGSGPGRADNAHFVLSEIEAEGARFVSAAADYASAKYPIAHSIDGKEGTGWAVDVRLEPRTAIFLPEKPLSGPELKLKLRFRHGDRHALGRFRLLATTQESAADEAHPSALGGWKTLFFPHANGQDALATDFGPEADPAKAAWADAPAFPDGAVHKFSNKIGANYLMRTITAAAPRVMRLSLGSGDGMKLWHNGQLVHQNPARRGPAADQESVSLDLAPGENRLMLKVANYGGDSGFYFRVQGESFGPLPADVAQIVAQPAAGRSAAQTERLRSFWRRLHWPEYTGLRAQIDDLRRQEAALVAAQPTTLIYKETAQPREAFILKRGEYTQRGDKVGRETPAALPPMAPDLPRNRLGLARWLVDPKHPLTARVAVNRLWQQLFGTGLVKTSGDLGGQGEMPSHPELLDWLAVQFIGDGWDVKKTVRRMVLSSTYRQSARVTPELAARDPENRLLARGPRFRLDAEALRDQALMASGLLVEQVGGPSVKPPQPDLWVAVGFVGSNTQSFVADTGPGKVHRRSLYTFWKRTAPAPQMGTFDAPSRESCTVRRERTNTPLQALLLMNDPQYVEAARSLAMRTMREGGTTPESRAAWIFRRAAARPASPKELEILLATYRDHRAAYAADPKAAAALAAGADDPVEQASWTMIANLVLNLDEVLTKG